VKIGIVDVDTSHPDRWIPIERELGHEVVGIWDGGEVHPPEYVKKFAADRSIPRVYSALDEMVKDVDCAIIHSCNWDTHVAKARPFVEAGKSVLLDKPLAGNLADLKQLCRWAEDGARITGGSSLRFNYETIKYLQRPKEERGTPHTVFCGCGVDEFNYGIHAYSLLSGILGPGPVSVRHVDHRVQHRVEITWADGCVGTVMVAGVWIPSFASIVTEKTVAQFTPDVNLIYRALLEATLPYLAGQTDQAPIPMAELIEPELCALAARKSWMNGNRPVALAELTEADGGYDGKLFAEGYRKARYPAAK